MIWLQAEKDRVSLAEGYIYYFVVIVLALSLSSSHVLFERYYWFLRSQSFFSQRWLAIFIDRDWGELNDSATEILSSSSGYEVIIQVVKLSGHIYSPSLVPSKSRLPRKCWYSVCMSSLCDVVAVKTVVLVSFAIRISQVWSEQHKKYFKETYKVWGTSAERRIKEIYFV